MGKMMIFFGENMNKDEIEKLKKQNVIVIPYGLYAGDDLIQIGIEIGIRSGEKNELVVTRYSHDIDDLIEKIRIAKEKAEKLPDTLPTHINNTMMERNDYNGFVIYRGEEFE